MKFVSTAVALATLGFVGTASAATCTSEQSQSIILSLASIATDPSLTGCGTESGYNLLFATALPTDEQYVKMCASDACRTLLSLVVSKNPADCEFTIPTSGLVLNVKQLAGGFDGKCNSFTDAPTDAPTSGPTSGPTSSPSPTTGGPSPTTGGPSPTKAPTPAPSHC